MIEVTYNTEMSISDIIAILSFISIIVGGIFTLNKWNINLKLKRAEYIKTIFDEIRSNPKIVFYLFEYDSIWYNEKFHGSKELESNIDYTLSYFSYICYLRNNNITSFQEAFNEGFGENVCTIASYYLEQEVWGFISEYMDLSIIDKYSEIKPYLDYELEDGEKFEHKIGENNE